MLRNARTVLAGGIKSAGNDLRQQVVGASGSQVFILSDLGMVQNRFDYNTLLDDGQFDLTLTGLFNTSAQSINAIGRPNRIGIGIERSTQPPLAYLADSSGGPRELRDRITIATPNIPGIANGRTGVYPITAYGSNVLVAVSQNTFTSSGGDSIINSIRKYAISDRDVTLRWLYPLAPRTYASHPAFLPDPANTQVLQIGISTSAYPSTVHLDVTPTTGPRTFTDTMYSVQISDPGTGAAPTNHATLRLPPPGYPLTNTAGAAHSYFVSASEPDGDEENFRISVENHNAAEPGPSRLWLSLASLDAVDSSRLVAAFTPWRLQREDLGLTVVAADIDRNAEGRTEHNDPGRLYYRSNPLDEVIVAYADPTGAELETNYLFVLRRDTSTIASSRDNFGLDPFIQHRFQGRLMAAGDLVAERQTRREELVVAYRGTVKILQLRDYNDPPFSRLGDTVRNDFFSVVSSFSLDGDVLSVAIADLDGDGSNDLIVTTTEATYAIGKKIPQPFGSITPEQGSYCPSQPITVRWNRRAGGGQDGVRVTLERDGTQIRTLAYGHRPAHATPLNPGTGLDSITFQSDGLPPGRYRIRIADTVVASLNDVSTEFVIEQPTIDQFTITLAPEPAFGDLAELSATVLCSDSVRLLRSYDGSRWDTLSTVGTTGGTSASVRTTLTCPPDLECGATGTVTIRFQFIDATSGALSALQTVQIPVPQYRLALNDSTSMSRRRTIRWDPANYGCEQLSIMLGTRTGQWLPLATSITASNGEYSFAVPNALSGPLQIRICCADAAGTTCGYGLSSTFEVPELPRGNYVAPNPYNPDSPTPANGALIVYTLENSGSVTASIVDASRAEVRRLGDGEVQEPGRQSLLWDGRNSRGEIVAGGTYICIIQSSSGEQVILPIIVTKR